MAHIEPFRGVRPRRDIAGLVAAPPYDVLTSDEARDMAAGNPYSFLHIGKPEIDLPPGTDPYSDAVYAKGRENFAASSPKGRSRRTGLGISTSTSRSGESTSRSAWSRRPPAGITSTTSSRSTS